MVHKSSTTCHQVSRCGSILTSTTWKLKHQRRLDSGNVRMGQTIFAIVAGDGERFLWAKHTLEAYPWSIAPKQTRATLSTNPSLGTRCFQNKLHSSCWKLCLVPQLAYLQAVSSFLKMLTSFSPDGHWRGRPRKGLSVRGEGPHGLSLRSTPCLAKFFDARNAKIFCSSRPTFWMRRWCSFLSRTLRHLTSIQHLVLRSLA